MMISKRVHKFSLKRKIATFFFLLQSLFCLEAFGQVVPPPPPPPQPITNPVFFAINTGVSSVAQMIKDFAVFHLQTLQAESTAQANLLFSPSPDQNWAKKFYQMMGTLMFANENQVPNSQLVTQSMQSYASLMGNDDIAAFPSIAFGNRSLTLTKKIAENIPLNDDDVRKNINNFNIDTILGQEVFKDENAMNAANNFVNMWSLVGTGFQQGANENIFKNYLDKEDPAGLHYMALMGSYAANASIGLSSLYQMIVKRYPQQQIKRMNLTDLQGNQIQSAAQLDRYLAERRALSPDWYATMAAASPATVNREILYLLAEMRLQAYRDQLQQERLLATMASIQMAGVQVFGLASLSSQQSSTGGAGMSSVTGQ